MKQFRKKPVVIEAFQLTYEVAKGESPVPEWAVEASKKGILKISVTDKIHGSQFAEVETLEGKMIANANDWIIQGINKEIYPCKPEIFEKIYDVVVETTFLERLILEEKELSEKIVGLNKGLQSDGFAEKVGEYQFELLSLQHSTMIAYRRVLNMRIKDLNQKQ